MKKKVLSIIGMVMALSVGVMGCSSNGSSSNNGEVSQDQNKTIMVTDQNGEVEVPVNPKNVVVLDYGSLDIMTKLGVEPVALPKSTLPEYLSQYKDDKYVDLGSVKEFDLEKINSVEPDLIIIEGRQASYYDDLKKIAPVLYLGTENWDVFSSAEKNAKILGQIFENEDGVTEELEALNKRVEAIKAKVEEENSTALMTIFNEGSLAAYGLGSRYDLLYSRFGFKVTDETIQSSAQHGQEISFEYIKAQNPDYLFVLDRGAITGAQASVKEAIENELVKTTNAYKNGKLTYVNPQAWYVGGSGLMAIDTIISDIETAVGIK